MTLLQSIDQFLDNITITDKQEDSIKSSLSNLNSHLFNKDNGLYVKKTFTSGSYERDTNIRPLKDIDLFAVLDFDKWKDENGNYPNPQSVLTKFKNYLNDQDDYKGKVKQDRPCVTVELSNKDFDILPSFPQSGGGYLIPNSTLTGWTFTFPEQLNTALEEVQRLRNYKVKPVIKAVKYWNRETGKYIPSYHIEEAAIAIFTLNKFANYEEAIRFWFEYAQSYLISTKFDSSNDYDTAVKKIKKVKEKLIEAKKLFDDGKEIKAKRIWKDIFDKEFPAVEEEDEDEKEAKEISKALSEGSLRISSAGALSTSGGFSVTPSKGYYGSEK